MKLFASLLLPLLCCRLASADMTKTLEGKVIAVPDPASLVVADATQGEHLVRLSSIIPVSSKSALYDEAKRRLSRSVLGKKVTVEWDRQVGNCDGKNVEGRCEKYGKVIVDSRDINLEMISKGLATHDQRALESQSTPDRTLYSETEEKARKAGVGIWNKRNPAAKKKKKHRRHK